jgi:Ice-binding-like
MKMPGSEGASRQVLILLVSAAVVITTFAVMSSFSGGALVPHGPVVASTGARVLPAAVCGQVAVPLASARSYAVLASSTVTSTGATALTGDLGLSPGTSVTGFPPGTITGTQNVTIAGAPGAEANLTLAYNNASGRTNCPVTISGNIGGETLTPGLYRSTSSLAISSGDLTLSGGGNPNGVFIFQVASAFTTTSGRQVILSNGAQAGNVFWQIGSSATIGTTSVMMGTIMAHDSISMLTGSVLTGRAMAETGEVSLAGTTITVPPVSVPSTTYAVAFTETGLAAGTNWGVTYGGAPASSTTSAIGFHVVSGTYAFSVDVVGYIASPASGTLQVNGASANQAIVFTAATTGSFLATFSQSGLTSGMSWSVTFNGVQNSSVTGGMGFTVLGGTYSFVVGQASNFTSSPSTGSLTVNGAGSHQAIAFTNTSQTGGGGAGNGTSSSGLTSSDWVIVGVVVVVAVAAVVGAALLRKRSPPPQ